MGSAGRKPHPARRPAASAMCTVQAFLIPTGNEGRQECCAPLMAGITGIPKLLAAWMGPSHL